MVNGGMSGVWDFCDIGLISRRIEPFAYVPLRSVWKNPGRKTIPSYGIFSAMANHLLTLIH